MDLRGGWSVEFELGYTDVQHEVVTSHVRAVVHSLPQGQHVYVVRRVIFLLAVNAITKKLYSHRCIIFLAVNTSTKKTGHSHLPQKKKISTIVQFFWTCICHKNYTVYDFFALAFTSKNTTWWYNFFVPVLTRKKIAHTYNEKKICGH